MNTPTLPAYIQRFFTDRLATQLRASTNTVASYRDTFRLLLRYVADQLKKPPTNLAIEDIDADLVGKFLSYVEMTRGNSVRSRNTRLSAIRSFYRYVAMYEPQAIHHCQRILAIPSKRYVKRSVNYLTRVEIEALIAAPDTTTWLGRRDRALLLLAVQTGLRVSEIINLKCKDVILGTGAHVRCEGKGRKERATPLRKDCTSMIRTWLIERAAGDDDPVFVSTRGGMLSRDAIERIVQKQAASASTHCPSLKGKKVSPHVLRHSAAMELLQNGVDCTVIALWLGHESVETTQVYVHANMHLKEKAMAKTTSIKSSQGRYRPNDQLLAFLDAL